MQPRNSAYRKQIFKDIVHIEKSVSLLGFIEPDLYQGLHLDELQQNSAFFIFSSWIFSFRKFILVVAFSFCSSLLFFV